MCLLGVDGPVYDVEEDVRPWKDDPGVLVNGVCVDPDIAISAGAHVARHLVSLHGQLHQHALVLHSILLWHAIVPCSVGIHLAVAG